MNTLKQSAIVGTNYYTISTVAGGKSTNNIYPQVQTMHNGYKYDAPNSCRNLDYFTIPTFYPNLHSFELHQKTKVTDFISAVTLSNGFLISEKVKKVVEGFRLSEYCFFDASIVYKTKKHTNYFYFNHYGDLTQYIDFEKTNFVILDMSEIVESVKFRNEKDLTTKYSEVVKLLQQIRTKKIHFVENFEIPYDIFHLHKADTRTYISHRLKTALEEANITGIEIVPTDVI